MPVDNSIYEANASGWWDENNFLHLLKTGLNPARFGYFLNLLHSLGLSPAGLRVLDVGCGAGKQCFLYSDHTQGNWNGIVVGGLRPAGALA